MDSGVKTVKGKHSNNPNINNAKLFPISYRDDQSFYPDVEGAYNQCVAVHGEGDRECFGLRPWLHGNQEAQYSVGCCNDAEEEQACHDGWTNYYSQIYQDWIEDKIQNGEINGKLMGSDKYKNPETALPVCYGGYNVDQHIANR